MSWSAVGTLTAPTIGYEVIVEDPTVLAKLLDRACVNFIRQPKAIKSWKSLPRRRTGPEYTCVAEDGKNPNEAPCSAGPSG
jgi:hypothetical protein